MADNEPKGEMPLADGQVPAVAVAEEEFDPVRWKEYKDKMRDNEKLLQKQLKQDRAELERLRQLEEERKKAELSEIDRLKAELAEKDAQLKKTTIESQQQKIAASVGLPPAFADVLKGETPEEMETHAKFLLENMPKGKAAPNVGATSPGEHAITGETEAQRLKRLLG